MKGIMLLVCLALAGCAGPNIQSNTGYYEVVYLDNTVDTISAATCELKAGAYQFRTQDFGYGELVVKSIPSSTCKWVKQLNRK